jgi:hypothetical protein
VSQPAEISSSSPEIEPEFPPIATVRGDLREFIAEFKTTLPDLDSHRYRDPSPTELAEVLASLESALGGDLTAAASGLDPHGYDLLRFEDTNEQVAHLMVRERQPMERGWALLLINLLPAAQRVLVEVPHPIWDSQSPELGIEAYLGLSGSYFLMAGAHRYASGRDSVVSDMARSQSSLFMALHRRLADCETTTLQYHGFKADNHPGYPNIVLSNGSPDPPSILYRLQAALEAAGESTGVYNGQRWGDLSGRFNPQAAYSRSIGGSFFHLEHRYGVRARPHRRLAVVAAMRDVLFASP